MNEANRKRAAAQAGNANASKQLVENSGCTSSATTVLPKPKAHATREAKASKRRIENSEPTTSGRTVSRAGEKMDYGGATSCGTTITKAPNRSTTAKAAASKTNRGTVERMDRLVSERPDLAAKVKATGGSTTSATTGATVSRAFETSRRREVLGWNRRLRIRNFMST